MTANKTISIIVPVFNVLNEINRCVESILSQSYRDIEVILVDDGALMVQVLHAMSLRLKMLGLKLFIRRTAGCQVRGTRAWRVQLVHGLCLSILMMQLCRMLARCL